MSVPSPRDASPAGAAHAAVVIRRAGAHDADRLAAFMERTFRDTYAPNSDATALEQYVGEHFAPAVQARELADRALVTLVAELDGALVAFAQVRAASAAPACVTARAAAELARFYVDRPWHGRGVAGGLMEACLAAAAPADALWLLVYRINARAIAFYERCGFVRAGTAPFRFGHEIHDDVVMIRSLVDAPVDAASATTTSAPRRA